MPRMWRDGGGEEDREWDRWVFREMQRVGVEWRTTAKDKKKLETSDSERNERKVRRRNRR